MKVAIVIKKLKDSYGPIVSSIQKAGYEIYDFSQQDIYKDYDYVIVFHNRAPNLPEVKAKIGWWMCDFRLPQQSLESKDFNFDYLFLCHKTYDIEHRKFFNKPLFYMPQCGLSIDAIEKGRDVSKYDVCFIGTNNSNKFYHRDRKALLEYLEKHFSVLKISGEKTTTDQDWVYNKTPLSLSVSYPMIEGTSNRLYNILASSGFALVKYFPGMEKQFINHKHLAWFETKQECANLIEYYQKNPQTLAKIKENAKNLFLEKHTADLRIKNMLEIMKGNSKEFWGYL